MMKKTILFVDDEEQILRSLKRLFFSSSHIVFTAESGAEALEILEREKINLLITDVLMPGMDGYQFLKEVKAQYPQTIRLVLSGYADGHALCKIQQNCLAKLSLLKPWKNQELLRVIENIFGIEELLESKNLLEVINKMDFLPLPDRLYAQVMQLINQDADIKEIAAAIENAPGIAAKILQVANSAIYGIKVGSVTQAITYLGLRNVKDIVLVTGLYRNTESITNPCLIRDLNIIWTHSVLTNKILFFLYQTLLHKKIQDACATAGLLHNIGKVVLLSKYAAQYLAAVQAISPKQDQYYYYEEMEFLAVSHAEIGAYLLSWWELPYSIVETALFHHNPFDQRVIDKELVALVHLAEGYAWQIIYPELVGRTNEEVLNFFQLTKKDSDSLVEEIKLLRMNQNN